MFFNLCCCRGHTETPKAPSRSIGMIVRNNLVNEEMTLSKIELTNGRWIWKPPKTIDSGSSGIWNVAFDENDTSASSRVMVQYNVSESEYLGFEWERRTNMFGLIAGKSIISAPLENRISSIKKNKPGFSLVSMRGATEDNNEWIVSRIEEN